MSGSQLDRSALLRIRVGDVEAHVRVRDLDHVVAEALFEVAAANGGSRRGGGDGQDTEDGSEKH